MLPLVRSRACSQTTFMNKNYGGVIWTKHSLARMRDRGIKQGDAWVTWRRPDQSRKTKSGGTWVYFKTFPSTGSGQAQRIEVVAKQNEKKEWIILSVWSRSSGNKVSKKKKSFMSFLKRNIFGK